MLVIVALLTVGLLLLAAMRPWRASVSEFELARRQASGEVAARIDSERHAAADAAQGVLEILQAILLVAVAMTAVAAFGWLLGGFIGVATALLYRTVARLQPIRAAAQWLYGYLEETLLRVARAVAKTARKPSKDSWAVASKEELLHIVKASKKVLTKHEVARAAHALTFSDMRVRDVMTPRQHVTTIAKNELLGPLTLDTLHTAGDRYVTVVRTTIDQPVGVLYVDELLVVTHKKTPTAAEAMDGRVLYIRDDHSLEEALGSFLLHHHHMSLVVDAKEAVVGVLTIEAVMKALAGYEIAPSFDDQADVAQVARRSA